MSSKNTMIRLMAYDRRAFEAFERGATRLGWAEAVKNREIGHLSIKDTLVHILNVHDSLLIAVAQGKREVWKDPARKRENIKSWGDLRRYRERVWRGIDDLTAGLTDAKLQRAAKVPWFSGRYTLEDVIFQSSFEQAHHLGEIIGAYWQMEKSPPQMMFIPTMLGLRSSTR
ncbi:MAG: DinB family protein [Thaumarchaeota archaeon]|nr:DinB family protein [Nitrososphaerota archaeon]